MSNVALIWITRKSEQEDEFIKQGLYQTLGLDCQRIIVGHTNLYPNTLNGDFEYIPFHEHGLDEMGLICHKKNIGILASKAKISLVLHADMIPFGETLDCITQLDPQEGVFYAPVAHTADGRRSLTWCRYAGQHKPLDEPECASTYISGGAIFSLTENFRKFPWDQSLRHNMEEDWELSRRIRAYGWKNACAPDVHLLAAASQ